MYQMEREKERMILVGVSLEGQSQAYASLKELEELAETAGAEVVSRILQNREGIHPATYVGKGKLEELRQLLYHLDADGIICDDELTPAQMKNLEEELACKIVDRTLLILDIFASRARTSEGKLQVETRYLRVGQAGRSPELSVPSGRRHRHPRSRREKNWKWTGG